MPTLRPRRFAAFLVAGVTLAAAPLGVTAPAAADTPLLVRLAELAAGKPVRTEDYGRFEQLGRPSISPNGRWVTVDVRRVDGHSEVHLIDLEADASGGDEETAAGRTVFEHASRGSFSDDGRWFTAIEGVSPEEARKLQKQKKPTPSTLILHDLDAGEETRIESVGGITFSPAGRHAILRRTGGARGVVIRDLESGMHTTFGGAATASWSDTGAMVAMVVEGSEDLDRSLQVFDAASGRLQTLDSGGDGYVGLSWREDALDLAVMRKRAFEDGEDVTHTVHVWRGLDDEDPETIAWDHLAEDVDLRDLRVVTLAGLDWSEDGQRLAFGTKAWDDRPAELADADADEDADGDTGKDAKAVKDGAGKKGGDPEARTLRDRLDEAAGVDVWHVKDVEIIPLQKRRKTAQQRRHDLGILHLDDARFVSLAAKDVARTLLDEDQTRAVRLLDKPYREQQKFGPTLYDVQVVDTDTGTAETIARGVKYVYGVSPDGRTALWQRDGSIVATDLDAGTTVDLTGDLGVPFTNQEATQLTDEKSAYGIGPWTADSEQVVLYDRWDAWLIDRDGGEAKRLTNGRDASVRHRIVRPDFDPDAPYLDPAAPMHFATYGEWTKRTGIVRRSPRGRMRELRTVDASLGSLVKADDAEVFVWTEQAFDDSPDVFVAGPDLADPAQVTETNAWLADHAWGRSELVDYTNDRGERMQGALMYPAGYVPGRTYPMIVYIYEKLSQNLHRFVAPSETSPYNAGVFTSEGYFVFMPDITYRPQEPGVSSGECVVPAVKAVVDRGLVDPKRVGIMGHSWGAYQTAWLVTHTDTFAAGVAGAPLTNMMSMSMSIYWNSGQTNAWIFHESQGRMDTPFWNDVDTYVRNSPIFGIDEMDTPLLVAFGDEDGAVDWQQGIEMYNAARLADKEMVMLVYEGENHGLRREPNRVDYHYRVRAWMDHHVKGKPAEDWITKGVGVLERERMLEESGRREIRGSGGGSRPGTARGR